MTQSNVKLAAASAQIPLTTDDDGAWYGGGLRTPRESGPAPRGSTRAASLPPPPPAAALRRSSPARPATEPAFHLPTIPLPHSADSDWVALSSSHFGSSLRPPEKPGVNWSRVSAIGLGAAALVGGLYTSILLDGAHRQLTTESRALHMAASDSSDVEVVRAYPLPPSPPSALGAIGPISSQRQRAAADSSVAERPAQIEAPLQLREVDVHTGVAEHGSAALEARTTSRDKTTKGTKGSSQRRPRTAMASATSDATAAQPETAPALVVKPLAAAENLPEQLTRQQVMTGLESVRPGLTACVAPAHGTSFASVTISGNGRVSYSTIDGAFAGTTQGSCMARVLRGAVFPRFASESFKVRYPFAF